MFLSATESSGSSLDISILFWLAMQMSLMLSMLFKLGGNLNLVKSNFLKLLIFSMYPLVLRTISSELLMERGMPKIKGEAVFLAWIFCC